MRTLVTALMSCLLLVICGFAQEQKIAEQPKLDVSKMHDALPDNDYTAKAADMSYVVDGERVLRQGFSHLPSYSPRPSQRRYAIKARRLRPSKHQRSFRRELQHRRS
ncbi:MAG: hypothetical protein ACR2IF_08865 [Terriglobales bacterium]